MNATRTALSALLAGLLLQGISGTALGANCTAAASTAWNVQTTWGAAGTGCAGAPGGIPGSADNVSISVAGAARAVTIPAGYTAQAASIAIGSTAINGPSSLTLSAATSVLSVGGAVTLNGPANNNTTNALNVNAGSATMASIAITGGGGNRRAELAITTGTATVTGDISFAAAGARLTFSSTGRLRIGGTLGDGATFTASTGTVEYNGGGAQTVNNTYSYNHLTINKGGGSTATLGGNTIVGGNLTVTAGILDLSTFTANRTAAGGTISVANGAVLSIGGINTFPTNYNTHTLGATSTVEYSGTNQSVAAEAAPGYGHLILSGSGTKTAAGSYTVRGDLSITGVTFAGTTFTQTVNGSVSNTGTHTATSGKILLSGGAAAHVLSGTGTYANLELNDANGATLSAGPTVSGTLTLTGGIMSTGSNTLITSGDCPGSVSRTGGYVAGFLRLRIPGPATCTFHVGDSTNYRSIVATFNAGTTAGDLTGSVSQAAGDHPNISTSGLDDTQSVNRYWTLTNSGVGLSASGYDATFNFVGDVDGAADPLVFEVERWDGAAWSTTTVGTRTSTSTQATGITAFGDFASGKKKPVVAPGDFNAFESSTTPNPGAVTGRLFTKLAGVNFSLDVVAILSGAQHSTFTNTVQVDLVTGSTGGLNCPGTPATIAGTTQSVSLTTGRGTTGSFNVATAYRDVRVRVRFPVASPTVTSCSTDNFSIRPAAFTVTSTNATQTDSSGTPAIKTGANFNLTAASVAGYDGTPSIDNTKVVGTPTAGAIGGSFGAAPVGTGIATGASFFYSEVGNLGLNANAVFDSSFTGFDQPTDCTADFSNSLVGGKYGCSFGSAAVAQTPGVSGFGRFIPDNFNVTYTTPPIFGTGCGTFTYAGAAFTYPIAVITVTARNGTNNGLTNATTVNYAGASYAKLTTASLNQAPYNTKAGRYTRFDALGGGTTPALDHSGLPDTATDPTVSAFTNGVGTLTFSSGTGLAFTRSTTTPNAPFNADIALALNVIDTDAVAFAGNPAAFGAATSGNGIAFSGGKPMRFGRLALRNANGSQLVPLAVPLETQYWNGTVFVTNDADNCTTLAGSNIMLTNPQGGFTVPPGACTTSASDPVNFSKGRGNLVMAKPTGSAVGSVDLSVNLGASASGNTCVGGSSVAHSAANKTYLQGAWTGGAYTVNPSGRATFGVYKGADEVIFIRENF